MGPRRLEEEERFLNAAIAQQRAVEDAEAAPRDPNAKPDSRSDPTALTALLLRNIDTKLDRLLLAYGPEDHHVPDSPTAVRVMMTGIRKEFDALHRDVIRLQRAVDELTDSLGAKQPQSPK
jgi:hypothetical protein